MISYKLYQDLRKKGGTMLWYARAIHNQTVDLSALAERIEHNCSMTKGDVLAVLTELVVVMKDELENSNKVCLDGFGTFYIGMINKTGADEKDDWNAAEYLKGYRCGFLAEGHKNGNAITRVFTDSLKCQRAE